MTAFARTIQPVVAVALLAFAGCQDTTGIPPDARAEGIRATVEIAPLHPVQQQGVPNSGPLPGAHISVRIANGSGAGEYVSDSAGIVTVNCAPGTYVVTPLPMSGKELPRPPAAQTVVVASDSYTPVSFTYDSGIR